MIKVVFFDLGLTLVDARNRPLPHVREALEAIQSFTIAKAASLTSGLVSDFDMAAPPATRAKVEAIFARYLAVLDETGLRPFFEPVARRVTLSTHAGVFKPDRKIFEMALTRLRSKASLAECLFITENGEHIRIARTELHMRTLHFRAGASSEFEFDDWLQAPPMVAHLIDSTGGANAEAALRPHLRVSHGFDLLSVSRAQNSRVVAVSGTLWTPVGGSSADGLANIHAPFAVKGEVTLGPGGSISDVRFAEPASTDVAEAGSLVRSLERHGQIQKPSPQPDAAATHEIETDAQGRRKLVRKRFQAI